MPPHFHLTPKGVGIFEKSSGSLLSDHSLNKIWQLHKQGKYAQALSDALSLLSQAQQAIPPDFQGTIPWRHLDNRAYLRLIHIAVFSHSALGEHPQAIALIEYALRINPEDNQGMRYLLASASLSDQQFDRAKSLLTSQISSHPSQAYELAWLHVQQSHWLEATTALRQAWYLSPQIGHRISKAFSQPKSRNANQDQSDAAAHIQRWQNSPASKSFFLWLQDHPLFQQEFKAAQSIRHALKKTPSANIFQRMRLAAQQFMTKRRIHDASSRAFLVNNTQPTAQQPPWASSAALS